MERNKHTFRFEPVSIHEIVTDATAGPDERLSSTVAVAGKGIPFWAFELNLVSPRLTRGQQKVPLTPKEFNVLALLASRPDRAVTRDEILYLIWGYDVVATSRSVDLCVNTLPVKIEDHPGKAAFVRTVPDIGCRFEACSPADES